MCFNLSESPANLPEIKCYKKSPTNEAKFSKGRNATSTNLTGWNGFSMDTLHGNTLGSIHISQGRQKPSWDLWRITSQICKLKIDRNRRQNTNKSSATGAKNATSTRHSKWHCTVRQAPRRALPSPGCCKMRTLQPSSTAPYHTSAQNPTMFYCTGIGQGREVGRAKNMARQQNSVAWCWWWNSWTRKVAHIAIMVYRSLSLVPPSPHPAI